MGKDDPAHVACYLVQAAERYQEVERLKRQFYVYKLIDPRTGTAFYVGKGKDQRAWSHTEAVKRKRSTGNPAKDRIIKQILAAREKPIIEIVAWYEEQADAFKHEIALIATLPGLVNIRKGGEGWAISNKEYARREFSKSMKESWVRQKHLRSWFFQAEKWPYGGTFPNHPNGDALAAEFMAMVKKIVAVDEMVLLSSQK